MLVGAVATGHGQGTTNGSHDELDYNPQAGTDFPANDFGVVLVQRPPCVADTPVA